MQLDSQPAPTQTRDDLLQGARPFLKWAGGKQQLLPQYEEFFPDSFSRYCEPFLGGGAVFFHLRSTGRITGAEDVYLIDNNRDLINTYRVVRDQLEDLIELLAVHQREHNKKYYYRVRALDRKPIQMTDLERAARTIYLNKTCFNGLYRVNKKGQFNVPIGSYTDPAILQEDLLRSASAALQGVSIEAADFETIESLAQAGDFVYFDPPYDLVSKTSSFTSYTAGDFGDEDQRRLAQLFAKLSDEGCLCMLSNSSTPFVLDLYEDFRIEVVQANRVINSNANSRGSVDEVVVLNY